MKIEMNSLNVPIMWYQKEQHEFSGNQTFLEEFAGPENQILLQELIESSYEPIHAKEHSFKKFIRKETEYLLLILPNLIDSQTFFFFLNTSNKENIFSQLNYTKKLENNYYKILESIYDDFTIIDKDGIIEKVLPNFESVYGIPSEEAIGSTIFEMEHRKIFNPCISARVMKSKKPETMLQVTKNNKYLMCAAIPIFSDNNELEKIISYTRDVEKYELLEEEHRKLQDTMTSYLVQLEQLKQEYKKNSKIIGVSQKIKNLIHTAMKVAKFDATVFINGESGVGKNMLADLIHTSSKRADAPFISINCGAIPEHLLESELFGYEKGAFTGAGQAGKAGLIELADHGTLFLDEICDLPLHMQVKLLKVIQEKKVIRVGGVVEKSIDFRLIAA
ncbi:MAG: sigma 54-interacting transcriptional regulator, partial [Anaerovorax sp.]|nr:sigma 54-interacting transcriptional regulator [Anaerovorax sp.]